MKEAKQYGEWVKASEELPEEKAGHYSARVEGLNGGYDYYEMYHEDIDGQHNVNINGRTWIEKDELQVIEWLKPVTGILLQKDEHEGLMKCIWALKGLSVPSADIKSAEAKALDEYICNQIRDFLSRLPETIK